MTDRAAAETSSPPLPEYGTGSLAEVVPSILAALGEPGYEDAFGLGELSAVCLFLVDGLGWEPLARGVPEAPFLSAQAARARSITTGFPSTTVASFASLGTGLPPGRHGLIGYTLAVSGYERSMNVLRWTVSGGGRAHGAPARGIPAGADALRARREPRAADGGAGRPRPRAVGAHARDAPRRDVPAGLLAGRHLGGGGGGARRGSAARLCVLPGSGLHRPFARARTPTRGRSSWATWTASPTTSRTGCRRARP